ncbi:MAG: hypothetical protein KF900_14240 [Bacteroidetes bacterium]|nr:hypothetical protein [Bacteroidota bacterium]
MKKISVTLIIAAFFGCQNNAETENSQATEVVTAETDVMQQPLTPADTIFFSYEYNEKYNDYALVYLLNKTYDKDSVCTANFKLSFIKNNASIYETELQIRGYENESEWMIGDSQLGEVTAPSLHCVSFGYPACGYIQEHFIFHISETKSDLVHQWQSAKDGGYGFWGNVVSGTPTDFYFRMETYYPAGENEPDDMGIYEVSDSIHFHLENNKWQISYLTPKDSAYRSQKIPFDDFH